jgi:hypothetical protein
VSDLGKVVNFNNGDGVVRATIVREKDDTKVYLWGPERGSGHITLLKGDEDPDGSGEYPGIPRRSPADYGDEGGGLTWHYVEDEV